MSDGLVVVNTSPILYLHLIGELDLLRSTFGDILVPDAVVQELKAGAKLGISVPDVVNLPWATTAKPENSQIIPLLVDLGLGEAEVLALGLERGARLLVIDDAMGRRMAQFLDLQVTGTLGILLQARRKGRIEALKPLLEKLTAEGMWISQALIETLLNEAGEG